MTSKRSGEGVRLKWTHADGGGVKPHVGVHPEIKTRVHWRHPVFFSCKEVGVFLPEFRLWTE